MSVPHKPKIPETPPKCFKSIRFEIKVKQATDEELLVALHTIADEISKRRGCR